LSSKAPQSRRITAGLLHEYVVENAVVWKQGEKPMTEVKAEAPKEKKVANRSRVSKEAKIVVLKKFEGRAESIRGKALAIAMAASTVEKAVADMRAAGFTAAVANATIKFAVAEQLIALKA